MSNRNGTLELLKTAIDITQEKHNRDNADNYILRCKNADVIWYQPMKLIACVRFCEDKNKNEYHLYNRCGAYLAPGDSVKVYYTTNAAKGWIAVRDGVPNYRNEYGQNIADIRNCCDDEDDISDNECCCDNSCCSEAAARQNVEDVQTVEEWDERIEGTEDEIQEYEENEGKDNPFYNFSDGNK